MSTFVEAFFDELSKLAAEKDETVYRPTTKRQMLLDQLKHLGYGAAGSLAGGLVGALGGTEKSTRIGSIAGGLTGHMYSRSRMRKRMARNLAAQGLDAKTMAKLEESGVLRPRFTDIIGGPVLGVAGSAVGRGLATKAVRQKLKEYGKKTRGIAGLGMTDPD